MPPTSRPRRSFRVRLADLWILAMLLCVAGLALWLLWLFWPLILVLTVVTFGYRQWQQFCQQRRVRTQRQHQLAHHFYQLLSQSQGRISVLEFAMHTRLTGEQARHYLHFQAQTFGAYFQRTVQGDILYTFPRLMPETAVEPHPRLETLWAKPRQPIQQPLPKHLNDARPKRTSPVPALPMARGRAALSDQIKTIDISAVDIPSEDNAVNQ